MRAANLALLAFAVLLDPAMAQTEETQATGVFGEEIAVDVVNLEVLVLDRQGRPVTGLGRGDFELYEDGKAIPVTYFSSPDMGPFEGLPETDTDAEAATEAASGVELETEARAGRGLHLVVYVDEAHLQPEARSRVFQAARSFLSQHLGPADRVMIVVHHQSLKILQPFTSDRGLLMEAMNRLERSAPAGQYLLAARRSAAEEISRIFDQVELAIAKQEQIAEGVGGSGPPTSGGEQAGIEGNLPVEDACVQGWGALEGTVRRYAQIVTGHTQSSIDALISLANALSGLSGRKAILYVASGLQAQPAVDLFHHLAAICPRQSQQASAGFQAYDLTVDFQRLTGIANANGVTLHTLEAETPDSGIDQALHDTKFRPSPAIQQLHASNLEQPLTQMAHETGGLAILNALDFEAELSRLAADLRAAYSLGYRPDHPPEGRRHTLEVRVRDGRYQVRYPRSYRHKPFEERIQDRIYGAVLLENTENPLGIALRTAELSPAEGGLYRVPLRIFIPLGRLTLLPEGEGGGQLAGRLRLMMAVTDGTGNLGPIRQKIVPITVEGREGEEIPGGQWIEVGLTLPRGQHYVVAGIRDEVGGAISYLKHRIRVD